MASAAVRCLYYTIGSLPQDLLERFEPVRIQLNTVYLDACLPTIIKFCAESTTWAVGFPRRRMAPALRRREEEIVRTGGIYNLRLGWSSFQAFQLEILLTNKDGTIKLADSIRHFT